MRDRWIGISLIAFALLIAGAAFAWNSRADGERPTRYVIIGAFALLVALLLPIILKKVFGEGIWERVGSSMVLLRLIGTFLGILFYLCYVLVTQMLK